MKGTYAIQFDATITEDFLKIKHDVRCTISRALLNGNITENSIDAFENKDNRRIYVCQNFYFNLNVKCLVSSNNKEIEIEVITKEK